MRGADREHEYFSEYEVFRKVRDSGTIPDLGPQTKVAHVAVYDAGRSVLSLLKKVLRDLIERSCKEKAILYAVHGYNPAQMSATVEQAAA